MRAVHGFSFLTLALAMALGLASTTVRAEDAPAAKATGTVSGKVVDADGKGIAGVEVAALNPADMPAKGAKKGGGAKPTPLAKATTGEDGTYKLEGVPAGKVMLIAHSKEAGMGRSTAAVEVTAGQDTKADDIKVAKRAAGGGKKKGADAVKQ